MDRRAQDDRLTVSAFTMSAQHMSGQHIISFLGGEVLSLCTGRADCCASQLASGTWRIAPMVSAVCPVCFAYIWLSMALKRRISCANHAHLGVRAFELA